MLDAPGLVAYLRPMQVAEQEPINRESHHPLYAALLRFKRWLMPRGSLREKWARKVYVPLLQRTVTQPALRRIDPNPRVLLLGGRALPRLPLGGRVLVLKLDHIGDLVVGLPALAQLRAALPDAEITLVCGGWNLALARTSGLVDHVVQFDYLGARYAGTAAERIAMIPQFAAILAGLGEFGLAIDLRHDTDTRGLLPLVRADVRAGYAAEGVALDIALPDMEHVALSRGEHPLHARTRLVLLVAATLDAVRPAQRPAEVLVIPGQTLPQGPYAVLAPGAGAPLRVWDITRMAALAQALVRRHGLRIVIVGGPDDQALGARIAAGLAPEQVTDLTGKVSLSEAPAILAGARLMVGMDSGLTHLAGSLGVATVSVHSGAATREVWRVAGDNVVVVAGDAACAPCHLALTSQCPHGVACLRVIGVADVLAACETVLARDAQGAGSTVGGVAA
jgi:ADP-heptose:LPS heptosyltransferase